MKVDVKKLPKSLVELTITVPYATYAKWQKHALAELNKQVKVDGFRAGSIPEDILRQKVGNDTIIAATIDYVLPQTYSEAVKTHNLAVIAQPSVDIKQRVEKEGDDFIYTVKVPIMPEVKVGNYQKIKVAKKEAKVDAKNIEETIQMLLDRNTAWQTAERTSKKGDRVEMDFEGFEADGTTIPGTASKHHPVVLGSGTMVPGFEESLEGLKAGDTKEFEVTFPAKYHAEAMQGKKVKFKATIHRVEEPVKQELTEEFIEQVSGKKTSIEDFKKQIEEDLKAETQRRVDDEHYGNVVKEVIKITEVDLPEVLVEQELELMMEEQKQRVSKQGLSWEQYLSHIKKTEDDFHKENAKAAEERLVARLGVHHILQDAKIEVSDQEVQQHIDEIITRYPEDFGQKVKDHYSQDDTRKNIRNTMAADKLIQMLTK